MRISGQHLVVQLRAGRNTRSLQGVEGLSDILRRAPGANELIELVMMGEPAFRGGQLRPGRQLWPPDEVRQCRPLRVVGDGDTDPAAGAAAGKDALRGVVSVAVAQP